MQWDYVQTLFQTQTQSDGTKVNQSINACRYGNRTRERVYVLHGYHFMPPSLPPSFPRSKRPISFHHVVSTSCRFDSIQHTIITAIQNINGGAMSFARLYASASLVRSDSGDEKEGERKVEDEGCVPMVRHASRRRNVQRENSDGTHASSHMPARVLRSVKL